MKLKPKQEIIDYLLEKGRSYHYTWYPLTWNIKVYDWSFTDGNYHRRDESGRFVGIDTDPRWDDKWEEHLESKDAEGYFWWACEDWLGFAGDHPWWDIMEGHADPAISASAPRFYTEGRSGGWLVLSEATINGWKYSFDGQFRYPEEWEEVEYRDLWTLYKFCLEMDRIVEWRHDHMKYWYADKRAEMERQWREEETEHLASLEAPVGPYVTSPVLDSQEV